MDFPINSMVDLSIAMLNYQRVVEFSIQSIFQSSIHR
jgi:hypothetical protein